jgi:hypothetical protein
MPPATMVAEESDIFYRACGYARDIKFQMNPFNISSIRTVMTPTKTVRSNYTFSTQYASTTKAYLFNFADLNEAQVPWDAFIGAGNCNLRDQNLCNGQNKTIQPNQYNPELSLGTAAVQTGDAAFAGCNIPNLSANVKYVPITAATVTAPSITHWGAVVSVGPKTPRLDPSPVIRVHESQQYVDTFPEDDFYPPSQVDESEFFDDSESFSCPGCGGAPAAPAQAAKGASRPRPSRPTAARFSATASPKGDEAAEQQDAPPVAARVSSTASRNGSEVVDQADAPPIVARVSSAAPRNGSEMMAQLEVPPVVR